MIRRRTIELGSLLAVVATIVVPLALAGGFAGGRAGAAIGAIVALLLQVAALLAARPVLLRACRATYADPESHAHLIVAVHRLSRAAGITPPRVAISALRAPNAFAARTPLGGLIGVTRGMLEILSLAELEAVLAHEIAHLTRRGRIVATIAAVVSAMPGWLAVALCPRQLYSRAYTRRRSTSEPWRVHDAARDLAATCALLPVALVRLSTSRAAEYDADAGAARLVGDPRALASALRKISGLAGRIVAPVNPAIAHLLLVHPFSAPRWGTLFDAHPPLADRLAAIERDARDG
jgi:heat shock protein HtpX